MNGNGCRKRSLERSESGVESSAEISGESRRTSSPRFESSNCFPTSSTGSGGGGGGGGGSGSGTAVSSNIGDHDPYGQDCEVFDTDNLPNDTMATVLSLQKEFYGGPNRFSRKSASAGAARHPSGGERTGIVLQHQIYTVLENRTAVDLELTSMRKENVLRTFHLGTGREDWGIMSTEHYLRVISNLLGDTSTQMQGIASTQPGRSSAQPGERFGATARSSASSGGSDRTSPATVEPSLSSFPSSAKSSKASFTQECRPSLARDVLQCLVRSNTKAYASRKQVSNAMRVVLQGRRAETEAGVEGRGFGGRGADAAAAVCVEAGVARGRDGRANGKCGGDDEQDLRSLKESEEKVLSLTSKLVRAGFLLPRRDVGREEAYWFSMPQLGKVVLAISRGRKDVVGALKRTRYKEMRRAELEAKNPAKSTGLPLSFHVRDLLGLGMIRETDTPSGKFLRLPSNAS